MEKLYKCLILCVILVSPLMAATFIPVPIVERLKYSDGLVGGTFYGGSVKKLPSGEVVTEYSFKVSSIAGISPNSIVNKDSFTVLVPGGAWNGNIHKISGTPTFRKGEEVILMVRKGPFGYIMPDLSFSKFSYKVIEGEEFLVSPIFPDKSGIGKVKLSELQVMSRDHFGTELVSFNVDKFIDRSDLEAPEKKSIRSKKRAPASQDVDEKEERLPFIWSILALGFLGFFSTTLSRSGNKK